LLPACVPPLLPACVASLLPACVAPLLPACVASLLPYVPIPCRAIGTHTYPLHDVLGTTHALTPCPATGTHPYPLPDVPILQSYPLHAVLDLTGHGHGLHTHLLSSAVRSAHAQHRCKEDSTPKQSASPNLSYMIPLLTIALLPTIVLRHYIQSPKSTILLILLLILALASSVTAQEAHHLSKTPTHCTPLIVYQKMVMPTNLRVTNSTSASANQINLVLKHTATNSLEQTNKTKQVSSSAIDLSQSIKTILAKPPIGS